MQTDVDIIDIAKGWPFLDSTFAPNVLLAAAATCRRELARDQGPRDIQELSIQDYLSPHVAIRVRQNSSGIALPCCPLDDNQRDAVSSAIDSINSAAPSWRPLTALPCSMQFLNDDDTISCSCFSYPQHIFLGARAFRSKEALCEQVLHELCHNWTYIIEEMTPLCEAGTSNTYTLPSGTSNKYLTEVLGAAYVGSVLIRWYQRFDEPTAHNRIAHLASYVSGCLEIARNGIGLTRTGNRLLLYLINSNQENRTGGVQAHSTTC